jgi:short-subunit dehydrogenase
MPELENLRLSLQHPENALVVPIDLEIPGMFAEAVNRVIDHFGRVDLLINNAGISQRSYVLETNAAVDRRLMEVNYLGTVALSKAVLPHMIAHGGGHFAVVTSLTGKFGYGARSAYAASKHALHGFFESLHIELHSKGIGVTMICPGPVKTAISLNALDGQGNQTGVMDEMQEQGTSVEKAAADIIKGLEKNKKEIIIGGIKEQMSVKIKAFFPGLFFKMVSRKDPRGAV